jgi:hypothetical protein
VIRVGIRRQLAQRLVEIRSDELAAAYDRKMAFIERLRTRPIAIETATANSQHYEVCLYVMWYSRAFCFAYLVALVWWEAANKHEMEPWG